MGHGIYLSVMIISITDRLGSKGCESIATRSLSNSVLNHDDLNQGPKLGQVST